MKQQETIELFFVLSSANIRIHFILPVFSASFAYEAAMSSAGTDRPLDTYTKGSGADTKRQPNRV
jgi:hypothetical protein